MKTILQITLLSIFLISNVTLSQSEKSKKLFVRVFDLNGKKFEKGPIGYINDTLLVLNKKKEVIKIKVGTIGKIKTKRSTGHDVLVGSAIGGITLAIVGAATSKEETKTGTGIFGDYEYTSGTSGGEGAAIGGTIGLATGALVGLGISAFKMTRTYKIDGDLEKWKSFLESENLQGP